MNLDFKIESDPVKRGGDKLQQVKDYIANTQSPVFNEIFSSYSFSELAEKESDLRNQLKQNPSNAAIRAQWLFLATTLRDAVYANRGRCFLRAVGIDNMFRLAYDTAKDLVNAGVQGE